MDFKVQKIEEDEWNIYLGDKVVGNIVKHWGMRSSYKILYVNGKKIDDVKSQTEAIQKLKLFYSMNKDAINITKSTITQVNTGIAQVQHQICIDILKKGRKELEDKLDELKSFDLI